MLSKRKYLFGTTILAGVMAVAAPAFAQEAELPGPTVTGEPTTVEEVVVTGSRLRRDAANSATPLISVPREALLNTGQNSIIDYLATIPALSNSRVPSDTVDVFAQGVGLLGISSPNLRSLGAGRTLTLVDGRRHVGSVGGSLQVDVDTIPRLLIESTEIVTGGASSVYGADAVSGVINFVLRKDFEGLEIDLSASQINQGGDNNRYNAAILGGVNLLDDRLNLWGFAEYEYSDAIRTDDIDWVRDGWVLFNTDADPAFPNNFDNQIDVGLLSNVRTLARPRWGQTTLANTQSASPLSDPDIPFATCNTTSATGFLSANCYAVNPGKTFLYEGTTARLANFGQRIGIGLSRPLNIGGDGANPNTLTFEERTPEMTAQRYAAGANFAITDNVNLSVDAKYVTEQAYAGSQPQFFDFHLNDNPGGVPTGVNTVPRWSGYFGDGQLGPRNYTMRYSDNAYLPQLVKDAITANTLANYSAPTANTPGVAGAPVAAQFARHSLFGPQRFQEQNRDLLQYTAALNGDFDRFAFVKNINWEIAYTYGEVENEAEENSVDGQRLALAADAVVDAGGVVNGRVGEIVCRAQRIAALGGVVRDDLRGGDLRDSEEGRAALAQCRPLNIFGEGNQTAEALAYIEDEAGLIVTERNESEQAIAFVSGELWDFFGAGPIGIALGAEYRREFTEAAGRDDRDNLFTFGLTAPDFTGAEYESEEFFGELSIPLFRDSWLGEYAEVSGSYRQFDYTTAGDGDVYGVNFVYRPIRDIGFKASYNTSFRAPNLSENFSPLGGTFSNNFVDPCSTASITGALSATYTAENRANRITNCTALAVARGYSPTFFDFGGATAGNEDDYIQTVTSPFGFSGGNVALRPETSESTTFTIVLEPRQIPDFSLVLDYYEIRIDDVISAVTVNQAAALCVDFAGLGPACDTIFRRGPIPVLGPNPSNIERSAGFQVAGSGPSEPAFIQGSVNFAGFQTRGLDVTANYAFDAREKLGLDIGSFRYSLRGTWLIEQKQFSNPSNPALFTEFASNPTSPRVRLTSTLAWIPTDDLSFTWTMDWQSSQDLLRIRDQVGSGNTDNRSFDFYESENFARHDFTVRYQVRDDVTLRAGVTNAFDNEPPTWLRGGFQDNIDPYGTRFFLGLNYRPF
jgi:outer membrane receptor protein involved in Fe transport